MQTHRTKTACDKLKKKIVWSSTSEVRASEFPTRAIENPSSSSHSKATVQNRSNVNSPIPQEFDESLPANVENANQPAGASDAEEEAADEQSPIDDEGEFVFQPLQAVSEEAKKSRLQILGARTSKDTFKRKWADVDTILNDGMAEQPKLDYDDPARTILQRTKALHLVVDRYCDHHTLRWGFRTRRLAVAALMIYRMRLGDVFLREHVMMMWVIFGEDTLRAHNGTCYYYNHIGYFEPLQGLLQ